ncbi:MAG: ABC transporter substrate-binding protein [Bradyrhizobiaceae bacterium]|nr:ABC transporter substrate-binding protein [Bradyrhizobiaceae bacterium]
MKDAIISGIAVAAATLVLVAGVSRAEEPSALAGVSAEEQARLAGLIDGARREGSLTYWDAVIQPETNDALTAAFRSYYGLANTFQVHNQLLATAPLVTRLEQEIGAGRLTVDVAAVGYPSWVFERAAAGDVLRYDSPQYRYYADVMARGLGRQGFFAFNGAYLFVPMWNADRIQFNGNSWRDVINAVPAGRISTGDVAKSAAYLATYAGQRKILDIDYFKAVAAMKPSFLIRSEQVAGRLVTGEDLMAFSGMPTRAYQYNQKGARLRFMLPQEGAVLLPQNMFILARAPHPNAAKLWVDFILSEPGQSILVRSEAMVSGRSGFKSPLPGYAPGIDGLRLVNIDWQALTEEKLRALREEWSSVFQP